MAAPFFSLILATYGRVDEIGRLMDSLAAQTCPNFELIFADQNPDDRVLPFVHRAQSLGWACTHLKLDKPNLSAARNAGLRAARGEWFAIPDDDCWYEPDTLMQVLARIRGPQPLDGLVIHWVEQVHRTRPEQDDPLRLDAWRRFEGSDASSIALFVRTELGRRVAGFDESMGVGQWFGAGEETDFLLRLLDTGAVIERLSAARVHHEFGNHFARSVSQEFRLARGRARGWGALCAKHRLPWKTVARGLVGPLLWPIFRPSGLLGLAKATGVLLGRWQGLLLWRVHGARR